MVGLGPVLQHTPLETIAADPSSVMVPPLVALLELIAVRSLVVRVESIDKVVKLICGP